jgi:hypothetical protein
MSSADVELDQEIFSYEVSNETVEAVAGARNEIAVCYKLDACTSVDCLGR